MDFLPRLKTGAHDNNAGFVSGYVVYVFAFEDFLVYGRGKLPEIARRLVGFKLSTGSWLDAIPVQEKSRADLVIWNHPNDLDNIVYYYKTGFHDFGSSGQAGWCCHEDFS